MALEDALTLFELLDGREDHLVSEYTVNSHAISLILNNRLSPTVVLGIKGIGKSTAIKFIKEAGERDAKKFVVLFDTTTEFFDNVPNYTFAAFRHRFRYVLLSLVVTIFRKYVDDIEYKDKSVYQDLVNEIEGVFGSRPGVIREILPKIEKITIIGATVFFDKDAFSSDGSAIPFDDLNRVVLEILARGFSFRFLVDDIDQMFSRDSNTNSAISGLVLACNELNVNYRPAIVANCFLKAHVFYSLNAEDISNISPTLIQRLHWSREELYDIVLRRLQYKELAVSNVFEFDRSAFLKLLDQVRNGPRDLVAWVGLSIRNAIDRAATSVSEADFHATYEELQEHSRGQVDFAYETVVPNAAAIVLHIFKESEYQVTNLLSRIRDLRVNDDTFVSYDEKNCLSSEFEYLSFLRQSGSIYVPLGKTLVAPYERDYMKMKSLPRSAMVRVHNVFVREEPPDAPRVNRSRPRVRAL